MVDDDDEWVKEAVDPTTAMVGAVLVGSWMAVTSAMPLNLGS